MSAHPHVEVPCYQFWQFPYLKENSGASLLHIKNQETCNWNFELYIDFNTISYMLHDIEPFDFYCIEIIFQIVFLPRLPTHFPHFWFNHVIVYTTALLKMQSKRKSTEK